MHHAAASAAPPSLIDVRHMYARGGAPAFAPIAKVPSFVELNARASSPGGVKVAPVKSLAHVAPIVPTAARAVGVGVGSRFDPNDLVRKGGGAPRRRCRARSPRRTRRPRLRRA
jgi:hypothetical protein